MIASIRARCIRAEMYRAAPAVRWSSSPLKSPGAAMPLTVTTIPAANTGSRSEYPGRPSRCGLRPRRLASPTCPVEAPKARRRKLAPVSPSEGGPGRQERPGPTVSALRWLIVIGLGIADADLILQLEEVLLAHATNVHQLFDLLERSVLLPVLDNERGGFGADTRQAIELGDRRSVDVDDFPRGSFRGCRARRRFALRGRKRRRVDRQQARGGSK